MPEEVTFDEASGIARVRAWGVDTIEDWLESRDRIIELYESHGIRRVLVDAREQESGPSTGEIFEFGETWPHEIRVAILSGQRNREDQEFLETVAFNRAKDFRIFDSESDALTWLGLTP